MELYATHSLQLLVAGNKKQQEMQDYIRNFDRTLLEGKIALDAMISDLKLRARELNEKYPRQKEISVRNYNDTVLYVSTEYDCDFCRLYITKLLRTYKFCELKPEFNIEGEKEKFQQKYGMQITQ